MSGLRLKLRVRLKGKANDKVEVEGWRLGLRLLLLHLHVFAPERLNDIAVRDGLAVSGQAPETPPAFRRCLGQSARSFCWEEPNVGTSRCDR